MDLQQRVDLSNNTTVMLYPEPSPEIQPRYIRFRNRWRQTPLSSPPNTVVMNSWKHIGKGPKVLLLSGMRNFVLTLNGQWVFDKLMIPNTGWINTGDDPERLTWGGNLGIVLEQSGIFSRLASLMYTDVPNAIDVNFQKTPWFIHKFTSINEAGYLFKLGQGLDAYTPLMRDEEPLWIETALIEFLPTLPMIISDLRGTIAITSYSFNGNETWGNSSEGSILLQKANQFYTSWRISTFSPPT